MRSAYTSRILEPSPQGLISSHLIKLKKYNYFLADDVYLEQQAQAQVEQQKQSNEYLMMGQQYYNYEAAGHQDQLFSSEPFFDHNMGQLTVGNQIQLTPSWE